ncbi:hypothetical protein GQ53DRAFT_651583 [Thozetella sp. PMI_491]|nr:hypothetical protein GQ53DRAFT_651583 [Thozetella sp. PMI_491]
MPTRPNWDKRISRDDMYLTTRPIAPQKKGLQPYRVGIKGATMASLPTPEPSPNAAPLSVPTSASIPARMPTPESLSSGEIQIGMALGSPVHAPSSQPTWAPQPPQAVLSPPPMQVPAPVPQRSKTQKRRLFGGLFGRKHSEPAPVASGSTESVVSVTTTTTQSYASSSTPTRSLTVSESRNAPRHKPIVVRSNTAPMGSPGSDAGSMATGAASEGPSLLDVEIPDIRLERYSVMFSGLLNPQGTQGTPSLLQRRQATLEKLKTINDNLDLDLEREKEKIRQRRATSPQPTKSPAGFTLFPSTPGREAPPPRLMPGPTVTPRRLSPRSRSNTSPALLPSPSKPNFPVSAPPKKEKKTVKIVSPRTMDEQNRAANVERLREQQAQQAQQARQQTQTQTTIVVQDKGFHFGPDESGLILDSPQSMDEEDVIHSRATKPAILEPQWQIISPPSSSASSVATKRSPSSASSVQTTVTRPSLDEGEAALQAAVEISIARQISVSRQQRQLLVPLQTNVAQFGTRSGSAAMARAADRSPNSAASASRSPINKLGRNERVAETKFSTPTLVVPRETLENQLAQHRKSERVVLES